MKILHSRILGSGSPLLILHGFLGMSDNWKSLGMQYADAGFQVHLIDQRNHGQSFWADQFDYPTLVDDLLNYMNHHRITSADLIGHSMGGKTAMQFACTHPDRVNRLLIADIGPKYYPPHHQEILGALNSLEPEDLTSRGAADKALSKQIKDWGIRQFLLKNLYWKKPGLLGFRMNLEILTSSMEQIGTPLPENAKFYGSTLFIRGERSNYILDEDMERINAHFPNSKLLTIPEAGHWLHAEKPDQFFQGSMSLLNS
jgi:pimeloyl-ACP methyl ester carboxylesterase